nr:uncharacterized protein LOC119161957 [Rhipicephalus microplus]
MLGCGDAVSLDFMVGSNGGHEEVRCDLEQEPPQSAILPPTSSEASLSSPSGNIHGDRAILNGICGAGHGMSAHTSISNSINLHRSRSHHSPPSFPPTSSEASLSSPSGNIHGDRAILNGICVGNSLATSALFSNDISGTVLRRVARMMAEELHALQHQERLAKGSVRDVATQTTERGVRSVL